MARIVSVGAALQDVYLIDHDDFGTNKRGFFNQIELGTKVDIDKVKFSTGGGATNAATTFARFGHESIFMSGNRTGKTPGSIVGVGAGVGVSVGAAVGVGDAVICGVGVGLPPPKSIYPFRSAASAANAAASSSTAAASPIRSGRTESVHLR